MIVPWEERPICLDDFSVKALIEGREIEHFLEIRLPLLRESESSEGVWEFLGKPKKRQKKEGVNEFAESNVRRITTEALFSKFAPWKVGYSLWVRETFGCDCHDGRRPRLGCSLRYRATDDGPVPKSGWRWPKFLPHWGSRLMVRPKTLRLERISGKMQWSSVLEKVREGVRFEIIEWMKNTRMDEECPYCGNGKMVIKWRHGDKSPFLGCSAYPRCRWTVDQKVHKSDVL